MTTFEYLSSTIPTRERLLSCDLCYAVETDDIIQHSTIENMFVAELIPMYVDERDHILVCQRCAESGAYLEVECEAAT